MKWIRWILAYVFDCVHRRGTWPHSRSCEEALAHMDRFIVAAPASAKNERAGGRNRLAQFFNGRQLASAASFDLQRSGSTIVRLLQHGLVFAIALIYSKNVFSAMVRALVSF
jgi:hypothetical protein